MKKHGIQLIAVTAVLAAGLTGCGRGRHYQRPMCGQDKKCMTEDITDFVGDARVSPEKKLEALAFQLDQITTQTMHGCLEGRTVPHTLNRKAFFSVEALVWKAYEDGLTFALSTETDTTTLVTKMRANDPHSKWEPGFRAGVGFTFGDHDYWDLYANYTYYEGKARKELCECDETSTFQPQWFPAVLGPVATFASAHLRINYDVLDIELGRHYFVSEALSVRPLFGARGAWINQKYNVNYDAEFFTTTPTEILATNTSFKATNQFGAGGLRGGAQMLWHFTPHWGLSGQISASVLYGRFSIHETVNGANIITGPTITKVQYKITENYKAIRTNIDAALGLQWEKHFYCNGTNLSLGLFYELSEWFKQNELLQVAQALNNTPVTGAATTPANNNVNTLVSDKGGDLGFQGFSFRFRFDF